MDSFWRNAGYLSKLSNGTDKLGHVFSVENIYTYNKIINGIRITEMSRGIFVVLAPVCLESMVIFDPCIV